MKCYVVIDTNVVLSALMYAQKFKGLDSSVPLKVLSLALEGKNKIIPIFNEEMLDEYKDVSKRDFSETPPAVKIFPLTVYFTSTSR